MGTSSNCWQIYDSLENSRVLQDQTSELHLQHSAVLQAVVDLPAVAGGWRKKWADRSDIDLAAAAGTTRAFEVDTVEERVGRTVLEHILEGREEEGEQEIVESECSLVPFAEREGQCPLQLKHQDRHTH